MKRSARVKGLQFGIVLAERPFWLQTLGFGGLLGKGFGLRVQALKFFSAFSLCGSVDLGWFD